MNKDSEKYPNVVIDAANVVGTYRSYYAQGKQYFAAKGAAKWTKRGRPEWLAQLLLGPPNALAIKN